MRREPALQERLSSVKKHRGVPQLRPGSPQIAFAVLRIADPQVPWRKFQCTFKPEFQRLGSEKLDFCWGQKFLQGWVDNRHDFRLVQDILKGFKPEAGEPDGMSFLVPSKEADFRKRKQRVMCGQLLNVSNQPAKPELESSEGVLGGAKLRSDSYGCRVPTLRPPAARSCALHTCAHSAHPGRGAQLSREEPVPPLSLRWKQLKGRGV